MLISTSCPLGGPASADVELYPASCDPTELAPDIFHARRASDRVHYRMVRNAETGTVRADPILDEDTINKLYAESGRADADLAEDAAKTYLAYGSPVVPLLPDRRGLLDVGCGEGQFLEAAAAWNMERLVGLEPARVASSAAESERPFSLVSEPLRDGLFEAENFSLITGFQVLDHLAHPKEALALCRDALVPGGIMYWICHDITAPVPRLLGKRCPMIDIQHLILYDRRTVRALFESCGFEVERVFGVANRYPIDYWLSLAPLPKGLRESIRRIARACGLGRLSLKANLGNLGIIARKPVE